MLSGPPGAVLSGLSSSLQRLSLHGLHLGWESLLEVAGPWVDFRPLRGLKALKLADEPGHLLQSCLRSQPPPGLHELPAAPPHGAVRVDVCPQSAPHSHICQMTPQVWQLLEGAPDVLPWLVSGLWR